MLGQEAGQAILALPWFCDNAPLGIRDCVLVTHCEDSGSSTSRTSRQGARFCPLWRTFIIYQYNDSWPTENFVWASQLLDTLCGYLLTWSAECRAVNIVIAATSWVTAEAQRSHCVKVTRAGSLAGSSPANPSTFTYILFLLFPTFHPLAELHSDLVTQL